MPRTVKISFMNTNNVPSHKTNFGKSPKNSRPGNSSLDQPLSACIPRNNFRKPNHNQSKGRYFPTPTAKTYNSKRTQHAFYVEPVIKKIHTEKFHNFENKFNDSKSSYNIYSKFLRRKHSKLPKQNYTFAVALPLLVVNDDLCVLMNVEKRSDRDFQSLHFIAGGFEAGVDANLYQTCTREMKEEARLDSTPLFELYHEVWNNSPHSEMVFYITPFEENFDSYGFDQFKYKNGDDSTGLIEVFGNRLVKLKDVIRVMETGYGKIATIATPHVDAEVLPLKNFHVNEPDVIVSSLKEVLKAFA